MPHLRGLLVSGFKLNNNQIPEEMPSNWTLEDLTEPLARIRPEILRRCPLLDNSDITLRLDERFYAGFADKGEEDGWLGGGYR